MRAIEHDGFKGVYWIEFDDGTKKLATVNFAPGSQVYGEKLVEIEGVEYRFWDPYRSKLAAAVLKGMKGMPIENGSKVLYLGAASGTTVSHVSDMIGQNGIAYCVEISSRPLRDLLLVCSRRPNMVSILADAAKPNEYCSLVEQVDVIYQDVAQVEQTEILLKNVKVFLRDGGHALFMIKSRSIDVTKEPRDIFREEIEKLEKKMEVLDSKILEPYEKDHAMIFLRK
jgi:fibrillarin-like pre-rRNA processing protein